MPFAQVNGQRLYYEDTGGSGPAIVFSHGLLMDQSMFLAQVAQLQDRYRCISWDQRGHGRTAGDALAPFTYYDSADDLAALLEHLNLDQAVLTGMSQGGFLSLRCALRHRRIVRSLILIDTQAGREDPAKLPGYRDMMETWTTQGLPAVIAGTIEQIILGPNCPDAAAWKAKWRAWKPANVRQCFYTLAQRDDIRPELWQITVPTLVIHGELDAAIALDRGKEVARELPDSQMVVIQGGSHACNMTHPDHVNREIDAFLARLDSR